MGFRLIFLGAWLCLSPVILQAQNTDPSNSLPPVSARINPGGEEEATEIQSEESAPPESTLQAAPAPEIIKEAAPPESTEPALTEETVPPQSTEPALTEESAPPQSTEPAITEEFNREKEAQPGENGLATLEEEEKEAEGAPPFAEEFNREEEEPPGENGLAVFKEEEEKTILEEQPSAEDLTEGEGNGNDGLTTGVESGDPVKEGGEQPLQAGVIFQPEEEEVEDATPEALSIDETIFPSSPLIEGQKKFWIKIFAEYSSRAGLIHDGLLTQPIYEEVNLEGRSRRNQKRYIKKRKRKIRNELKKLALALTRGDPPSDEGRRLLALFPADITPKQLRHHAREVRFQRGLSNRFQEGLVTSGALLKKIKAILVKAGVPPDIAYLPHVESSFNIRAYSKFGAAGIWQFTRGTGKIFLNIKYEVDERLDPLLASKAAGKFLKRNHERLKTWPLAITAYNHGPQGLERIVAKKKTRDLSYLIKNYHGRLFKFASKNFYSEFLAAREVATHYEKYFGPLELDKPQHFKTVKLPFYLDFLTARRILKVKESYLQKLNPSLRTPVIVGTKYIPKGYQLRVPGSVEIKDFLSSIPKQERYSRQKLTEIVRVQRGDTLYGLGKIYNVPWQVIARANNITAYHRIRPGQRIVIPRRATGKKWVARVVPKQTRKIARKVAAKAPPKEPGNLNGSGDTSNGGRDSIAFQKAEGAQLFQDLDLKMNDPKDNTGLIIAAYGETLGHYADWSAVSTQTIRRYNGLNYGSTLHPGQKVTIPLKEIPLEHFTSNRFEFHQSREEDFYSTYAVSEVTKVKVRRGDSVWYIAQSNNVPMWLFYQHNPKLINNPIQVGMKVSLPVIEELADLSPTPPNEKYRTFQ